jgi:hypothetical protein
VNALWGRGLPGLGREKSHTVGRYLSRKVLWICPQGRLRVMPRLSITFATHNGCIQSPKNTRKHCPEVRGDPVAATIMPNCTAMRNLLEQIINRTTQNAAAYTVIRQHQDIWQQPTYRRSGDAQNRSFRILHRMPRNIERCTRQLHALIQQRSAAGARHEKDRRRL